MPTPTSPSSATWARVRAPVRILDAGGWTDTWFAGEGRVCHLCVGPGAEAFARKSPCRSPGRVQLRLRVPDYGDEYSFPSEAPPDRHPLLEAALRRWAPAACDLEVVVSSAVPAGCSLGTSASVVVALIKVLQALGDADAGPAALAHAAHDVETVDLGRQSGVQDQVAAAFGGANLVHVAPYPRFEVKSVELAPETLEVLTERVLTLYLGAHDSSEVHRAVIDRLTEGDGAPRLALEALRAAAQQAADALLGGDIGSYGDAMVAATRAQATLHPMLINPLARQAIEVAAKHGALGWKINGAGGPGGSLSIISGGPTEKLRAVLETEMGLKALPLSPSPDGAAVVDAG